ncbi:MAG: YdeI/OmpD-associated family protein [Bacteroidetes bacterium]|nr:YdeI/OmpD-associated family protein [Bacteroidota bacterium]MBS1591084.1 YdeI/OmpD-associated family protein [Bacteroidota bacterium]
MKSTNLKVDAFYNKAKKWKSEMELLREIVLSCGLTEELKWYQPCYTLNNANILIVSGFKEFCVLSFFKGSLLKDKSLLLSKPGENTQSGRWIKFTTTTEINQLKATLKTYIKEAIAIEKKGLKVPLKNITAYAVPQELETIFKTNTSFKKAFTALTPGRQKGYLLYFSQAKQTATRKARIEKYTLQIMQGKGLHD